MGAWPRRSSDVAAARLGDPGAVEATHEPGGLIGSKARNLVARSLVALVETARRVSRERDYSVRAVSYHSQLCALSASGPRQNCHRSCVRRGGSHHDAP